MRELSLSSGMVRLQIQPLTPLVDEFAGRLFGELDYIQEGLNAERFQVLKPVLLETTALRDLSTLLQLPVRQAHQLEPAMS